MIDSDDTLWTDKQCAKLLGISVRFWWTLHETNKVPRPIKLGNRFTRWNRVEIMAWFANGCPTRRQWDAGHERSLVMKQCQSTSPSSVSPL